MSNEQNTDKKLLVVHIFGGCATEVTTDDPEFADKYDLYVIDHDVDADLGFDVADVSRRATTILY